MSDFGFIVKPSLIESGIYNPSLYVQTRDYLTLENAESIFMKLNDNRIIPLIGVTAGTALASKALVLSSDRSIIGVGTVHITKTGQGSKHISDDGNTTLLSYVDGSSAYFGTLSNTTLALQTNNSARMLIHPSGNISMGNSTDSGHRLDVTGNINCSTVNCTLLGPSTSSKLMLQTNGANRLEIDGATGYTAINRNGSTNGTKLEAWGTVRNNVTSGSFGIISGDGTANAFMGPASASGAVYFGSTSSTHRIGIPAILCPFTRMGVVQLVLRLTTTL